MDPHKVHVVVATVAAVVYGIWRRYYATIQVDRLSELPDEILLHILSYMSLPDVARMSMVSTKWRSLCLEIPSLDLDWWVLSGRPEYFTHNSTCEQGRYKRSYVRHVHRVLRNYKNQNTFKSFRLVCCLDNKYENEVNRWIKFAAANKGTLQSLTLYFICIDCWRRSNFDNKLHEISGSFLSQFSYLQHLHLDSCILRLEYNRDLILPRNLTTLDLVNVILLGGELTQWQRMLSNCSSTIECLRLKLCYLPNKLCIGNNFLRLRLLVIGRCQNLQEIELSAEKLNKFEFYYSDSYKEPFKCTFNGVSNLESVHMNLKCGAEYTLESLAVGTSPTYMSLRGYYPLMSKLPTRPHTLFSSVLKLRISSENDDRNIVSTLPRLIQSFPLLEMLEIELLQNTSRLLSPSSELPTLHVHNNLKEIRLLGFKLISIPVAIYLLQCASVLDRMVITKSFTEGGGMEPWEHICILPFPDSECQSILDSLSGKASSTNVRFIFTSNITIEPMQLHAFTNSDFKL